MKRTTPTGQKPIEADESHQNTNERRAQWERFTMIVLDGDGGGYVNVRNDSYDDPNDHIHSVHVEDGHTDGCSCPHHVNRGARCKHMIAVEERPLIVSSAQVLSATPKRATDGGETAETCENGHVGCPGPYHLIRAMCEECTDHPCSVKPRNQETALH